jgi:hypothetical protein
MKNTSRFGIIFWAILFSVFATGPVLLAEGWTLAGWNDLGMHCMDADYSVFSILPPYNNIHAQLIDSSGSLVDNPGSRGIRVTYEAVADPSQSLNKTSAGKTNFWNFVDSLFGTSLAPDVGLTGNRMPGPGNTPQEMTFDTQYDFFKAEGIPITPYDDTGAKNYYPMMRLTAWNSSNQVLAVTDIVLPVSDEMDCRLCHASNGSSEARPGSGWVYDPDPEQDYRLNILLLHDERRGSSLDYANALSQLGYNPDGLYDNASTDGNSILCASCHRSNALPGTGVVGIPALTQSIHSYHAGVEDPLTSQILETSENRQSCYRCHPGSETRCLRGVMGRTVAQDGSMAIQCQDCHGSMTKVGSATREGWFDEPTCQNCHTGTALNNNGQIRYLSAFENSGNLRVAVNHNFATNSNTPAPGVSLYRFSSGHGGLQCEGCHGSTHAEYPASHENDNVQSLMLQGNVGTIGECLACHGDNPETENGGPHGMHPVGQFWVEGHKDAAEEGGKLQCRNCHGTNYRGTVLSRSFASRTLNTEFGNKVLWRGYQVGCYLCHDGPDDEDRNSNSAPTVSDRSAQTMQNSSVIIQLSASDPNGDSLELRIVTQPYHGSVALINRQATFYPETGFSGQDSFTYAAWDGSADSNLASVSLSVTPIQDVNNDPSANAGDDQNVFSSQAVSLNGSGSDQDGDTLSFSWSQLSGPAVVLTDPGDGNASFTAPAVTVETSMVFRMDVTDGKGGAASDEVTITVMPAEVDGTAFYFPQVASGSGGGLVISTRFIFLNTGENATVTVEFYNSQGDPMALSLEGQAVSRSSYQFNIAKGAALNFRTVQEETFKVGYAKVLAGSGVDGNTVYIISDDPSGLVTAEAGVPSSRPLENFSFFADSLNTANTGLVIVNPVEGNGSDGPAVVTLRLYDKDFKLINTRTVTLQAGEHVAKYFNEIFLDVSAAIEMEGVITGESDRPVAVVVIRQNDDPSQDFPDYVSTLTIFPVMPGRADQ